MSVVILATLSANKETRRTHSGHQPKIWLNLSLVGREATPYFWLMSAVWRGP